MASDFSSFIDSHLDLLSLSGSIRQFLYAQTGYPSTLTPNAVHIAHECMDDEFNRFGSSLAHAQRGAGFF